MISAPCYVCQTRLSASPLSDTMSKRAGHSDSSDASKKQRAEPAAAASASSSSSIGSRSVAAATEQAQLVQAFQLVVSDAFELMEFKDLCSEGMNAVLGIVFEYCGPSYLEQICEDDERLCILPAFNADHDLSPKFRKAIHDLWHLYAQTDTTDKHLDAECARLLLLDMCGRGRAAHQRARAATCSASAMDHGVRTGGVLL